MPLFDVISIRSDGDEMFLAVPPEGQDAAAALRTANAIIRDARRARASGALADDAALRLAVRQRLENSGFGFARRHVSDEIVPADMPADYLGLRR